MDTMTKWEREFERTADGGWLEVGAVLPEGSTAKIRGNAIVTKEGAKRLHGGTIWGGTIEGGTIRGGTIRGGTIEGGTIRGGTIEGGTIRGGTIWGGVFYTAPCMAQRSDGYCFVAKYVVGVLRIWAGCRDFSWEEAVAHWNDSHKHGAESQRIIHFLKAQAEAERDRDAAREAA